MKLQVILCLLLILKTNLSAFSTKDLIFQKFQDNPRELFKVFHLLFEKTNHYLLDSEEAVRRYKIFKSNLKWIHEKNSELGKVVYGITPFADLTDEEFEDQYLMKLEPTGLINDDSPAKPKNVKNIDWRSKMKKPRHQLKCGSCWAFATLGSVEGNFNIKYNQQLDLSVQDLVDCNIENFGCIGGFPDRALTWMHYEGIRTTEQYPYEAKMTYCDSNRKKGNVLNIIQGFDYCSPSTCKADKWYSFLEKGPLVVKIDAKPREFKLYHPEHEEPIVPSRCRWVNHAVIAVGAITENGKDYLIGQNSWGVDWGFQGFFKIEADTHCGMMSEAWYPLIHQHQPFQPESCPSFFSECYGNGKTVDNCQGILDFQSSLGGPVAGYKVNGSRFTDFNLYELPKCKGTPTIIKNDNDCFANNKNENKLYFSASAFTRSREKCVTIFEGSCFTGRRIDICIPLPDITQLQIKKIGSIAIDRTEETIIKNIVLYDEINFKGKAYEIPNREDVEFDNPELFNALQNAKSLDLN